MSKEVVSELVAAMTANDGDRIRAAFADHARQAYGDGEPKSGDAFRAWLESDIIAPHGQVFDAEVTGEGDEYVVKGEYRNTKGYRNAADFLIKTENGKIVSWQMRY